MADRSSTLLFGFVVVGAVTLAFFAGRRSAQLEMRRDAGAAASEALPATSASGAAPATQRVAPPSRAEPALTVSAAAAIGALGDPAARPPSPEAGARLDKETSTLLAVRQALDANDGAKALALLDKHDKDFPDGILAPDARMLRVEALAAAGKSADAVAAADAFLADFPHHPEAARIRGIRDRLKPAR